MTQFDEMRPERTATYLHGGGVKRYFVPVCLYPHTKYRTRDGLRDLFVKYELAVNSYMIVVADRLLALDRLMTGRFWKENSVFDKARREGRDVFRLIGRVAKEQESAQNGEVLYWDDLAGSERFTRFRDSMVRTCRENLGFLHTVEAFARQRTDRFAMGARPEKELKWELEYIFGEITMSVYCTEILGFNNEVWERPPRGLKIDPLNLLYAEFPSILESVCGNGTRSRVLNFLYDD